MSFIFVTLFSHSFKPSTWLGMVELLSYLDTTQAVWIVLKGC